MNKRFLAKSRKYLIIISFIGVFLGTLIINIPAWVLNSELTKYSEGRLTLYNLYGTFWNGSGLLVASSKKSKTEGAPLAYLHWKISLGLSKYIDIQFMMDKHKVAEVFLNKDGLNIDRLDLSLSVIQASQLVDVIKDLNISGNFHVTSDHILLAKKTTGIVDVTVKNVSSGLSPVNPLGDYTLACNIGDSKINVSTKNGAVLNLSGNGTTSGLTLKATINPDKAEAMKTFITLLGTANSDGSYNIKLF